jgi:type VI secretion system protein ImpJ
MKLLNKPVWAEGMYLGPHHFQVQSRYFEDSLNFVTANLWRDAFGFAGLEIDNDALRNGTLTLTHANGLFEDGLAFDLPGSDPAPPPREFRALFSPVADSLTMHLAVPASLSEGRNTSLDSGPPAPTRYQSTEHILPDENTGRDEKPIKVGRKNLQLLGEAELTDQFVSLPILRIVRDGSGRFEVDQSFVPPCLTISASGYLTGMLRRLIEILDDKSAVFSREQQQRNGRFEAGMSSRHVAQYWFLHALNSSVSTLRHFLLSRHVHPQELFREMSRLAGALCTFGLEVHPRSLPVYNHRDMGTSFELLDQHILRHLEIVMPSKAITIPLRKFDNSLYAGEVKDERCVGPSRWLLEIRSPMGEADLMRRVPLLVKVCSARFVIELVKRALPGLGLTHLPTPPAEVAAKVDSQYFVINRSGPCWQNIVETRQAGVHVPGEIPSPEMNLIVLLDNVK